MSEFELRVRRATNLDALPPSILATHPPINLAAHPPSTKQPIPLQLKVFKFDSVFSEFRTGSKEGMQRTGLSLKY
jgi:hypothetical protein